MEMVLRVVSSTTSQWLHFFTCACTSARSVGVHLAVEVVVQFAQKLGAGHGFAPSFVCRK